jgi:hypothetical protein
MPRTTIDIDASVLRELKRRQKREGKTLGQLVSELLADALARQRPVGNRPLRWPSEDLRPLVDLEDKEAMMRLLDRT